MGQALGARAQAIPGDLAFWNTVTVRVLDADRYHRLVAGITLLDGKVLNHEVHRAGLAWWYRRYARHETALEGMESEAKAAKRGLWPDPMRFHPGLGGKRKLLKRQDLSNDQRLRGRFRLAPLSAMRFSQTVVRRRSR